ncbi:MAG: acylphosphatase [Candidatus Neomarinimicrobiota bacterium]|jgi:acylphosphatase|nr:acylphosphatase [Candidatus Neomarinimicrobiota bacterium]MDD3965958.1 acylphosphatase [Candidatus Neomarinimicrobiota bacterium]MDX9779467.1 acylphosphatase [bacterium]
MNEETVKITISGQVQMVGYRWFAKQQADALGIRGYVRNSSRGDVEIIAKGKISNLENFIEYLRKGPSRARVTKIRREACDEKISFDSFRIRT